MGDSEAVDVDQSSKEKDRGCGGNKHGIHNWIVTVCLFLVANYVIENYLRYGIIKTPLQITDSFFVFIGENWWMYKSLFLGYLLQIVLCFLNEKCLSMGIVQEPVGMGFHVFNSTLLFNLSAFLFTVYKINPVAAVAVSVHSFHMSIKSWGYAYTNMVHRKKYKKKISAKVSDANGRTSDEDGANGGSYPQNVTLKNTFEFMACTGSCAYSIYPLKRKPVNFRNIWLGLVKVIGIYYAIALLMYQYLLPEADRAVSYIDNGQYLELCGSALRLALPVTLVWLSYFYYYCFEFYLPVFGWIWGTEDIKVGQDWWNSENSTVFWVKWNYQVHIWFKECFFLPMLLAGYSKRQAAFVVALVSGIIHEYLICIPCRTSYGLAMLVMISQIPLASFTTLIAKKYGAKWGNMTVWLNIVFGQTICAIYLYYNYIKMSLDTHIK